MRAALAGFVLALAAALAFAGGPGFLTQHLLDDHFARYGRQFGAITVQQYLHMAQQLRDAPPGRSILVSQRRDGGAKFDTKRGWFVAYNGDGTLRTFFMPKDGAKYFARQAKSPVLPE